MCKTKKIWGGKKSVNRSGGDVYDTHRNQQAREREKKIRSRERERVQITEKDSERGIHKVPKSTGPEKCRT